jgi:four helix bundle protein
LAVGSRENEREQSGAMMSNIQSYKDLKVWQKSMEIARACYGVTKAFPKEELFGMTSQIRRAAASVPANIAEGYGRDSRGEYVQFLRFAQGSLKELETHLILAEQVRITALDSTAAIQSLCDEVGRMLRSLIRSLQSSTS